MTIIHISSIDRVKKLLTISGLCRVEFDNQNYKCSASAKVDVQSDGKEMAGYVLAYSTNNMKVHMVDNSIIVCDILKWAKEGHIYDYLESVEAHYIKEFVPICFAIMNSGDAKITLNCFIVDQDGKSFNNTAVRL